MPAGVRLKFFQPRQVFIAYATAFRLRVEACDAVDMDERIFVYERAPLDPYTKISSDHFSNVAGAVDLAEIPPDNPVPGRRYPYLRKNFVDVIVRSTSQLEDVKTNLTDRVRVLTAAVDRLSELELTETLWIGQGIENGSDASYWSDSNTFSFSDPCFGSYSGGWY